MIIDVSMPHDPSCLMRRSLLGVQFKADWRRQRHATHTAVHNPGNSVQIDLDEKVGPGWQHIAWRPHSHPTGMRASQKPKR